jgi:hypothetical protein
MSTDTQLKRFIIVERQDVKNVYEVMARDADHAQELFDDGDAIEIGSDIKHSEAWVEGADEFEDDEDGAADSDEEDAE